MFPGSNYYERETVSDSSVSLAAFMQAIGHVKPCPLSPFSSSHKNPKNPQTPEK